MSEAAIYQITQDGGREGTRTVRLRLPAQRGNATLARLALSGVLGLTDTTEATLAGLKLAVADAVGLAIDHALARGSDHVEVVYELSAAELSVAVSDDGIVFDPIAGGGESELPVESIRQVVDSLEVEGGAGELRLRFAKHLHTL
jgi:anti-sigma regulatory factor (Ser/Thr protein kinase)